MEYENKHEYAKRGVGNTALGLAIGSLGWQALGGNLGGLFGGGNCCSDNMPVTRFELNQQNTIATKDMEIAYLKGREEAKSDSLALYQYVDGRLRGIEAQIGQQAVYNATNTAVINCLQNQVNTLMGLTKVVIPNTSVCPGWGNVTVAPATTTTG
jgi:hypothetical protein